jgi:hypothetical protein
MKYYELNTDQKLNAIILIAEVEGKSEIEIREEIENDQDFSNYDFRTLESVIDADLIEIENWG